MALQLVTEKEESLKAFEDFKENFSNGAAVVKNSVGWQGGSGEFDVFVHKTPPVWGVLQPRPPKSVWSPRFWLCFGTHLPEKQKMLAITVEINPAHEGVNKRLGGAFLKDQDGKVFIAHTGKVGGGRKGIGAGSFSLYCKNNAAISFKTSYVPELNKEVVIMGPVKAKETISQISGFVRTVQNYKALSAGEKKP